MTLGDGGATALQTSSFVGMRAMLGGSWTVYISVYLYLYIQNMLPCFLEAMHTPVSSVHP